MDAKMPQLYLSERTTEAQRIETLESRVLELEAQNTELKQAAMFFGALAERLNEQLRGRGAQVSSRSNRLNGRRRLAFERQPPAQDRQDRACIGSDPCNIPASCRSKS